jgi:glycosyltransferase involved in cell wall biosynthesis
MIGQRIDADVVIPTFRRPDLLRRALEALSQQTVRAREIVVVMRAGDEESRAAVGESASDVIPVVVTRPGVLAAMTAGAARTHAPVVAFLDDDAAPHPTWLATLLGHFDDASVGGVGGRDVVDRPAQIGPPTRDVGRVTAWGRVVGNHHLGEGPPREVSVLKGVNMAFRREALALPQSLRGSGAQVHFEVASCLWARERGWRLTYDPAALVEHTVGPRFDADRRTDPEAAAVRDAAYNLVVVLGTFDRWLAVRRVLFGVAIGDSATPGLVRWLAAIARGEHAIRRRAQPSLVGLIDGLAATLRGRTAEMWALHVSNRS